VFLAGRSVRPIVYFPVLLPTNSVKLVGYRSRYIGYPGGRKSSNRSIQSMHRLFSPSESVLLLRSLNRLFSR